MLGLVRAVPGGLARTVVRPLDLTRFLRRTRRVTVRPDRVHVELRDLDHDELLKFAEVVEPLLLDLDGVLWAEVHAASHRLIAAYEAPEVPERVVALVEDVEGALGVEDRAFPDTPTHAADVEPLITDVMGIAADVVGIGVGSVARLLRVRPPPIEVDLAVALSVVDQVVPVRRAVQSRIGKPATDLTIGFGNSVLGALVAGPAAPAVDLARRTLVMRELTARRSAWLDNESLLFGAPPGMGPVQQTPPERPVPLPDGPVETYAKRAVALSGLGFAALLISSRRLDRAVGLLYAGLPKTARLGREGFAGQLGRTLADRGLVAFDPSVLRLLDRLDRFVVDADLLGDRDDQVPLAVVTSAAEAAEVEVVVVERPAAGVPGAGEDLLTTVQRLQREGHVVGAASSLPDAALAASDLGLGVARSGSLVPWGAHLVTTGDPADLILLIHAAGEARRVSRESTRMAAAGSGLGAALALTQFPGASVSAAPNASTLAGAVALANGYRRAAALSRRQLPVRQDHTPWHALHVDDVLARLHSSPSGLTAQVARERRRPDQVARSLPVAFVQDVAAELANPLTPVLAAGAGLSAMAGSVADAVLVSSVVLANGTLGGAQRLRADRATATLLRQRPQRVVAIRDDLPTHVLPKALVPGDVVRLQAGEAVPADCRILTATGLEVDESALTGESLPTTKSPQAVDSDVVAERTSMLFEGTWIAAGETTCVVVACGDDTEAQRAVLLAGTPPTTGIEARLSEWTTRTLPLALGAGAAVVVSGLLHSRPMRDTMGAGVSLAVAAVPESLPLLATAAQLAAARRLARHNVLIRNPRAIEALGRVDVLCADKTGTLTEGHIVLRRVSDGRHHADADHLDEPLRSILAVAVRATPVADDPQDLPHPTDRAIARAAVHYEVDASAGNGGWAPDGVLAFEPGRGFHAATGDTADGRVLAVKGAPEVVLPRCTTWLAGGRTTRLGPARRKALQAEVDVLAGQGFRVLAVAESTHDGRPHSNGEIADESVERLTFRGLVALADPARDSAAHAVMTLEGAGIRTIMVTGDHPSTARGIGVELGLLPDGATLLTGADLDRLADDELAHTLRDARVVARVTPAHKVRIVRALQADGRVVAMTGDGANDAPAIRLADVGVALGKRGTTAAQAAADLVVLDDRIETLVEAVVEGRAMWGQVRDAVAMLVGGNIGEIVFTVLGSLVSGLPPLNARQLLLVNMLTDALPALALAVRSPHRISPEQLLQEGPDRSLGDPLTHAVAANAVGATLAAGSAWLVARVIGPPPWARTVAMAALVGSQLGQALTAGGRDPVVLLATVGSAGVLVAVVQTPGVGTLFGCVPLGPVGWSLALGTAALGTVASRVLPDLIPLEWLLARARDADPSQH